MTDICLPQDGDVIPWTMMQGKITQVKIQGTIFIVNEDVTENPIKVAKDFVKTFNIPKSTIINKTIKTTTVPTKTDELKQKRNKRIKEIGEVVGKENNLPIIKEKIIGFFRKYPDQFTMDNMKNYWTDMYINNAKAGKPIPTELTVLNKQRATLKWLVNKGYVKQIEGRGNYKRKYEWKERPWDATPAAQADVNSKFLMDMRKRELIDMRQG